MITSIDQEAKEKIVTFLESYNKYNYVCDWVNSLISKENQLTPNFDEGGDPYVYGAKWFDYEFDVEEDYINISGDSAWSPVEGMCQAISKEFNCHVLINYSESGCDFGGESNFINGEEDIMFEGSYRAYSYYSEGLECLNSDTDWIDDEETLNEIKKEWLSIVFKHDREIIEEWYKEELNRITEIEKI